VLPVSVVGGVVAAAIVDASGGLPGAPLAPLHPVPAALGGAAWGALAAVATGRPMPRMAALGGALVGGVVTVSWLVQARWLSWAFLVAPGLLLSRDRAHVVTMVIASLSGAVAGVVIGGLALDLVVYPIAHLTGELGPIARHETTAVAGAVGLFDWWISLLQSRSAPPPPGAGASGRA
jgi:hypothetical protein